MGGLQALKLNFPACLLADTYNTLKECAPPQQQDRNQQQQQQSRSMGEEAPVKFEQALSGRR